MRHFILLILTVFVFLFSFKTALPEDDQFTCGMPNVINSNQNQTTTIHRGGKYITSSGTLRVLVIFVRFLGDNEPSDNWPDANVLPDWAQNFVNTTYSSSGNYYPGCVSDYFYKNSYGNLHVIGDVYYITTDYNEDYYHQYAHSNGSSAARGLIESQIFNKLDNPPYNVNFANYDNWNKVADWDNEPGTDHVLDMCWFITRNLHDQNYSTSYKFGIGWSVLDCSIIVKDGITIDPGDPYFNYSGSSGIGMFEPHKDRPVNASLPPYGKYAIVNHVAHEMSHQFFGAGHFSDLYTNDLVSNPPLSGTRSVSCLKSYFGGFVGEYSGYEKWRLNWMQPKTITTNGDNYVLYDLASTITEPYGSTNGRLFKIDIQGTNQFFLIENRRWTTPFEPRYCANSGSHGKLREGILIYQIISESDILPSTQVQKIDADGRFRWKMLYHGSNNNNMWDDTIDKDVPDRENGYSETERIYITGYSGQNWYTEWHPSGLTPYGGGAYKCTNSENGLYETGDDTGDSLDIFQVGDVLTPWSNPASHKWTGSSFSATTLGVEISSLNSDRYTLKIRLTNPEQLAPSKPQNLRLTKDGNNHPVLNWDANLETDLSSYRVYKKLTLSGGGSHTTYVSTTSTSYTDTYFTINPHLGNDHAEYWIVAVDNTNKLSIGSDHASTSGLSSIQWKQGRGEDISYTIMKYELHQNYPNPFNPTTTIQYDVKEKGFVQLKVYDILGKEVAELVNEVKEKGIYESEFNASELPTGIYFYSIRVNNFVSTKKMILMK